MHHIQPQTRTGFVWFLPLTVKSHINHRVAQNSNSSAFSLCCRTMDIRWVCLTVCRPIIHWFASVFCAFYFLICNIFMLLCFCVLWFAAVLPPVWALLFLCIATWTTISTAAVHWNWRTWLLIVCSSSTHHWYAIVTSTTKSSCHEPSSSTVCQSNQRILSTFCTRPAQLELRRSSAAYI